MENSQEHTDTFLADWLAGKLTDDELRAKISSDDFNAYQKLRAMLDSVEMENPDLERNYAAVKAKKIKMLNNRHRSKIVRLNRVFAIAAAILVLIGLFNFFVFSNSMVTGFGEQSVLGFDDQSLVTVNAKSRISYPNFFGLNRKIKLDGEAFFEVSKGGKFIVKTRNGDVEVLGTKFNVISLENYFEVACFEGKVKVCTNDSENILLPGDVIRFYNGKRETLKGVDSKPRWIAHESSFQNTPIEIVIREIENQYDKKIQYPESLRTKRFTGSFTHENLATALQSVCVPMQLKYTKTNGKITIAE